MSEDRSDIGARLNGKPGSTASPPASISSYNPYAPAPNASGSTYRSNMGQLTPVKLPDELRRSFAIQIPEGMRRKFTVQGRRNRASSYSHPPSSIPSASDTSNAFPDILNNDDDAFDVPTTWHNECEIPTTSRPRGQSRPRSQSMREGVPLGVPAPHIDFRSWKEGEPLFPAARPALLKAGKVVLNQIATERRTSMVGGQRKYFYEGGVHDRPPPQTPSAPRTPKTPETPAHGAPLTGNPYGRGTNSPPLIPRHEPDFSTESAANDIRNRHQTIVPPSTMQSLGPSPSRRSRSGTVINLFGIPTPSQALIQSPFANPSSTDGRPSLADLGLTLGQGSLEWVTTSPAGEAYDASHALSHSHPLSTHSSSKVIIPLLDDDPEDGEDETKLRGGARDNYDELDENSHDSGKFILEEYDAIQDEINLRGDVEEATESYDNDFEKGSQIFLGDEDLKSDFEVGDIDVAPNDNGVARLRSAQNALSLNTRRNQVRRRMSQPERPEKFETPSAFDSQFAIAAGTGLANAPISKLKKSQTCNDLASLFGDKRFSDQAKVDQDIELTRFFPWCDGAPGNMEGGATSPGSASEVIIDGHMTGNNLVVDEQGSRFISFPPIKASTYTNQNTRNTTIPPVKYHTFYQQVLQTTDSAEINRRIGKANSEGFIKHNIGSGPRRTPPPSQARDESDSKEHLAFHNQPRSRADLINRGRGIGFTPVPCLNSQRHLSSRTPRSTVPSRPLPAIPTTSTSTQPSSQLHPSSGRSTPLNMNNYASFGDGQQMGTGRQASSASGMMGNVMGGPPPQMNAVPMPAGHQADLSYILSTVEQLQDQLASNKATSDEIVRKTGIVRQRAIEREQKAGEVMKAAEERLAEQGKNMDEALSKMRAELETKSGKGDYWRTLALRAAETLANQNKLLHEMKVKASEDILWWHTSYRDQLADEREENLKLRNQIVDMQASAARGNEALRQFRRIYDRSDLLYELKTQIVFHRQNARSWKRQAMKLLPDDDSEFSDDDDLIDPEEKKRQAVMNAEAEAKRELMEEREAQGLDPKTGLPRNNNVQATDMRREYEPRSFAPQGQTVESFVAAALENSGVAGFGNNTSDPRSTVDDLSALADSMGLPSNIASSPEPKPKTGMAASGTFVDADDGGSDDDNVSVISVTSDMSESTKVLVDLMKNGLRGNTMYPMSDSEENNDEDEGNDEIGDGKKKKEPHHVGGLFGNKVKEKNGNDKKDDDSKGGDGARETSNSA